MITYLLHIHSGRFQQGYDIELQLEKKDENNMEGLLMGMFSASGKRLKE